MKSNRVRLMSSPLTRCSKASFQTTPFTTTMKVASSTTKAGSDKVSVATIKRPTGFSTMWLTCFSRVEDLAAWCSSTLWCATNTTALTVVFTRSTSLYCSDLTSRTSWEFCAPMSCASLSLTDMLNSCERRLSKWLLSSTPALPQTLRKSTDWSSSRPSSEFKWQRRTKTVWCRRLMIES